MRAQSWEILPDHLGFCRARNRGCGCVGIVLFTESAAATGNLYVNTTCFLISMSHHWRCSSESSSLTSISSIDSTATPFQSSQSTPITTFSSPLSASVSALLTPASDSVPQTRSSTVPGPSLAPVLSPTTASSVQPTVLPVSTSVSFSPTPSKPPTTLAPAVSTNTPFSTGTPNGDPRLSTCTWGCPNKSCSDDTGCLDPYPCHAAQSGSSTCCSAGCLTSWSCGGPTSCAAPLTCSSGTCQSTSS